MSNKNQNKIGYKHTPLGWIPEEWEVKSLQDVVDFLDAQRKPIKESDRRNIKGIYPYYGASGIIDYVNDYIFDDELILLGEDGANIINRSTPLAFRVKGKIWVNNHAHVLKPKNGTTIGFLSEFLESLRYDRYNTGSAQPKLNKEICSQIPVLYPLSQEQYIISKIASTWDEAITKTKQLIAQVKERNKGLMQQLLSGNKRLEGFKEEWVKVKLGDYLIKHEEKSSSSSQYPVLTSSREGLFLQRDYYKREVASLDNTGYNVVPLGYFTYRHMSDDLIFKFNINDIVAKGIVSTLYPVFTTKDSLDKYFLKYKLNNGREFMHFAQEQKQGGSRTYIYFSKLSELKVMLPSLEEQIAIRSAIDTAYYEQSIYQKELAALQLQKKGLMQKLLTGEVRVKI